MDNVVNACRWAPPAANDGYGNGSAGAALTGCLCGFDHGDPETKQAQGKAAEGRGDTMISVCKGFNVLLLKQLKSSAR